MSKFLIENVQVEAKNGIGVLIYEEHICNIYSIIIIIIIIKFYNYY